MIMRHDAADEYERLRDEEEQERRHLAASAERERTAAMQGEARAIARAEDGVTAEPGPEMGAVAGADAEAEAEAGWDMVDDAYEGDAQDASLTASATGASDAPHA